MTTNVIFSQIILLVCMFGNKKKTHKHALITRQRRINLDTKRKSRYNTQQNSDTLMLEDRNKVWKTNTHSQKM